MNLNIALITPFVLLYFSAVSAGYNKLACVLYMDLKNPDNNNFSQVFVIQNSESIVALGTNDLINTDWHQVTGRVVFFKNGSLGEGRLNEMGSKLNPKGQPHPVVAFVAEITSKEKGIMERTQLHYICPSRWYRVHTGVLHSTSTNCAYELQMAVFDRVVCFFGVEKFGDKPKDDTAIGFATFLEYAGEFYPKPEDSQIQHREAKLFAKRSNFDYTNHCKPNKMIAVKYGASEFGTEDFSSGWEYYRLRENLGSGKQGFKFTRI